MNTRNNVKDTTLEDLDPVKDELARHLNVKDIVNLSFVCKFLYIWTHSVCGLLEDSISGHQQKPKWNNRWVIEDLKMYPADKIGVKAWPEIPFIEIQKDHSIPDWATNLPNVFVSVDLFSSNISDVSALGNVHTLDLRCCYNVSDVSALGNVHTLYLCGCDNVSDVSALGNVHTLNLCYCDNISDVSALGNVKHLTLPNGNVEKRE